jgi:hypothetical protein
LLDIGRKPVGEVDVPGQFTEHGQILAGKPANGQTRHDRL